MNNIEKRILTEAITNFELFTEMKLIPFVTQECVELELRDKEFAILFNALVVPGINKTKLGIIQKQLNQFNNIPVLVTRYINTEFAILLKELGINFIDTAGNTFIKVPPLFIFIKGNRRNNFEIGEVNTDKKAKYKTAAMQLIFTLLCNPGLERNPYREIAQLASIALGTVQLYLRQLELDGFLLRKDKNNLELINKEKLLHLWVEDYPQQIMVKNIVGRYEIKSQPIDIENTLHEFGALLGGETAAARVTKYLRPYIQTIYIDDKLGEFILRNRLKKNLNGNILLMKKFWNFDDDNSVVNLVPNILIYADLISTGDPRNIETANIIYDTKIVEYIR